MRRWTRTASTSSRSSQDIHLISPRVGGVSCPDYGQYNMNMKQQTTTPEQFLQLALENRSVSIGDNDGAVHEFLTGLEGVVNFGGVGWKHNSWRRARGARRSGEAPDG